MKDNSVSHQLSTGTYYM